jgi:hypothetical protein
MVPRPAEMERLWMGLKKGHVLLVLAASKDREYDESR